MGSLQRRLFTDGLICCFFQETDRLSFHFTQISRGVDSFAKSFKMMFNKTLQIVQQMLEVVTERLQNM